VETPQRAATCWTLNANGSNVLVTGCRGTSGTGVACAAKSSAPILPFKYLPERDRWEWRLWGGCKMHDEVVASGEGAMLDAGLVRRPGRGHLLARLGDHPSD
jgi:hypothetical protein